MFLIYLKLQGYFLDHVWVMMLLLTPGMMCKVGMCRWVYSWLSHLSSFGCVAGVCCVPCVFYLHKHSCLSAPFYTLLHTSCCLSLCLLCGLKFTLSFWFFYFTAKVSVQRDSHCVHLFFFLLFFFFFFNQRGRKKDPWPLHRKSVRKSHDKHCNVES